MRDPVVAELSCMPRAMGAPGLRAGRRRALRSVSLALVAAPLAVGVGCAEPEVLSDYQLQLRPRLLGGQDPFASAPSVKLLIRHAEGGSEILYLGEAKGGQVELGEVPPLTAGSTLGVLLEEPGGEPNKYNPRKLVGYGEVVLDVDLGTDGLEHEIEVLVAQYANLGDMGRFGDAKRSFRAAAAMLPGGDVLLFGGSKELIPGNFEPGSDSRILRLTDADAGTWSFERVGDLPEADGGAHRAGATATVVEDEDGDPLVFVAGGRPNLSSTGDSKDQALLYDPEAGEFVWGTGASDATLSSPRSDHGAIVLASGDVFLYGGLQGESGFSLDVPFEIFDVQSRTFLPPDGEWTFGELGMAAASLGANGVLVCGGGNPASVGFNTVWNPVADCNIVTLQGLLLPAPPLPLPVQLHAMAPLPDGQVLATGGVLEQVADLEEESATNRAWVYNGSVWEEIAPMNFARAHHIAIPMPNGEVVIVGGGPTGGPVLGNPGDPVVCTEIYDPATRGFTTAGASCTSVGAGGWPVWSSVPGEGAFVLAGFEAYQSPAGGDAYGMIGFGPDLQ